MPAIKVDDHVQNTMLSDLYGSTQPARSKSILQDGLPTQRSPVQKQEIERTDDGLHVKINPTRLFVSTAMMRSSRADPRKQQHLAVSIRSQEEYLSAAPLDTAPLTQRINLQRLKEKKIVYKWNISTNGMLIIGESHPGVTFKEHQTPQERKKLQPFALGHVTLVGGQKWNEPWEKTKILPMSRISGTLFCDENGDFCIDNDSGRFSEYEDKRPSHLYNVAAIFSHHGLPVKTRWLEKKKLACVQP